MGNALLPCYKPYKKGPVKLVFWGGSTHFLPKKQLAGEVMFQFPDRIVCHGDSFYIGRPLPVLSIDDVLCKGETYFILPVDRFPCHTLTATSLAGLSPCRKPYIAEAGQCPFEYMKDNEGRTLIKVLPDFITRAMTTVNDGGSSAAGSLCGTAELQKDYDKPVGSRERPWSQKLDTIAEKNISLSSSRLLTGTYHLVEQLV